jgi:hypothetical protein
VSTTTTAEATQEATAEIPRNTQYKSTDEHNEPHREHEDRIYR